MTTATETPSKVAYALEYDFGLKDGIEYAHKVARTAAAHDSDMASLYTEAAEILQSRQNESPTL